MKNDTVRFLEDLERMKRRLPERFTTEGEGGTLEDVLGKKSIPETLRLGAGDQKK